MPTMWLTEKSEQFVSPITNKSITLNADIDRFLLLRRPSIHELRVAIVDYQSQRIAEVWGEFSQPLPDGRLLTLFRFVSPTEGKGYPARMSLLRTPALLSVAPELSGNNADVVAQLSTLNLDRQREIAEALRPSSPDVLQDRLYDYAIQRHFDLQLDADLDRLGDPLAFLDWCCELRHHAGARRNRIWEFLTFLASKDILRFPLGMISNLGAGFDIPGNIAKAGVLKTRAFNERYCGGDARQLASRLLDVRGRAKWNPGEAKWMAMSSLLLSTHGAAEPSDFSTALIEHWTKTIVESDAFAQRPDAQQANLLSSLRAAAKLLDAVIRADCHAANIRWDKEYSIHPPKLRKRSPEATGSTTFLWLTKADARFSQWADLASSFVGQKPIGRVDSVVRQMNPFFRFLLGLPLPPLSPEEVDRRRHIVGGAEPGEPGFLEYLRQLPAVHRRLALNYIAEFFGWYADNRNESVAQPFRDADFRMAKSPSKAKTTKECMPVRLMALCKQIITENDYAWPKTLDEDWIAAADATTGKVSREWCPVRAIALYTLLTIPIRGHQCQMLDSGEGDEFVIDSATRQLVRNPMPHAEPGRRAGILREIRDRVDGSTFLGFYINTNKTTAIWNPGQESGYEIPWHNRDLIDRLLSMRDWNHRFNPTQGAHTVNEMSRTALHASEIVAENLPRFHYLFRDPCLNSSETQTWEPVSPARLTAFFRKVLAEAERRLAADGEDLVLITEWESKADGSMQPVKSIFTLHSLRVSGITAFALAGVPIHVLTEFIAGHATVLMNIYYQKIGPAQVNRVIQDAHIRHAEDGLIDQYLDFLDEQSLSDPSSADMAKLAFNDTEALRQLREAQRGIWSVNLDGICPNGGTMCHEGGAVIRGSTALEVPGGPGTCPRCRFWITGPAFLPGQIIKSNELLYRIREKAALLVRLQNEEAELGGAGSQKMRVAKLRTDIDRVSMAVEHDVHEWGTRLDFVLKSVSLSNNTADGAEHASENRLSLLTRNSEDQIRIAMEECHDFDLVEFINQSCEIFPEIDNSSARLRKGRLLDRLLAENGIAPFLFRLDEQTALRAGNALTRLLVDRVGHQGMINLIDGAAALSDLGLTDEVVALARQSLISSPASALNGGAFVEQQLLEVKL